MMVMIMIIIIIIYEIYYSDVHNSDDDDGEYKVNTKRRFLLTKRGRHIWYNDGNKHKVFIYSIDKVFRKKILYYQVGT